MKRAFKLAKKLFLILLLWIMVISATGQDAQPEKPKPIKPPRDFRPSIIRLSYDMIPLGASLFSDFRSGQGFQGTIDFDQYFLAVEYGNQKIERGESYQYTNSGSYFGIGPEVNLLKNDTKGNALTFGLRYGHASFSDALSFATDTTFFGVINVEEENNNLKANWMELTFGLNANVWKQLYMGFNVRYKVLRNVKNIGTLAPYDVPGFGLYEDNTGVIFNYYIGWGIKLRDKYPDIPTSGSL